MKTQAEKLMKFIDDSPSIFHAAENVANYLTKCGFIELFEGEPFDLKPNEKYFINKNSSAIIAWRSGADIKAGFRIIASHLDSPTFKIKPNPEIQVLDRYTKLNTEMYGGAIISTWFDRPLSVAGQIFVAGENTFTPKRILVNIKEPILVIPNLAIHMNPEINNGYKYNKQVDTLPLFASVQSPMELKHQNTLGNAQAKNSFMECLAFSANVNVDQILSYDLFLYDCQPSTFVGSNKEMFLASKIDNLGMAFASLQALCNADVSEHGQMICLFNNEEVGSETATGAGSPFFADTLKRIAFSHNAKNPKKENYIENSFELFHKMLAESFLISADQAHATHPNYLDKNDITNFPVINGGPVVKASANMSYTSEAHTVAIFKKLCSDANIPYQTFVNRSDIRGGSTIGPITMTNLQIKSVDIGNPILAMHSIKELAGSFDQYAVTKVFDEFFK